MQAYLPDCGSKLCILSGDFGHTAKSLLPIGDCGRIDGFRTRHASVLRLDQPWVLLERMRGIVTLALASRDSLEG